MSPDCFIDAVASRSNKKCSCGSYSESFCMVGLDGTVYKLQKVKQITYNNFNIQFCFEW